MNKHYNKRLLKMLAKNIKKCRKQAHLRQNELAAKLNKSTRYIVRLERGRVDIPITYLNRILECLNVELRELLNFDKL